MSAKEHLKSSEATTVEPEPGLGREVEEGGGEKIEAFPAASRPKEKTSPALGCSPDRYRQVKTLIQIGPSPGWARERATPLSQG